MADTGMIRFRGVWPDFWCGDAQTGYILKAYREHQTSSDNGFLTRTWPQIRKALEFLIAQDGNDDGAIEGKQHNTYDINFYGPNPMVGILYLGALRAGEEMAKEQNDEALATRCRKIYEAGRKYCTEKLFNGEYYIQLVDLTKHPQHQHADGCLADQLFGQGWAHQVALDYVLPQQDVRRALEAIWKYNWAPDSHPRMWLIRRNAGSRIREKRVCSPAPGQRASTWDPSRCCTGTRSGPGSNTKWLGTWSGKAC